MGWDISVPWLVMGITQRRTGTAWPHPPRSISPLPACTGAQPLTATASRPPPLSLVPTPHPGGDNSIVTTPFPPRHAGRRARASLPLRARRNASFTDGQVLRYIMDNSQREDAINNTDTYRGKKVHS